MTSPNTIHSAPLSFQIASTLTNWAKASQENALKDSSIASKTLVVVTTTAACIGAPFIMATSLIEAVASGILGGIGATAIAAGVKSVNLEKFTVHSLAYSLNSLFGTGFIFATLIPDLTNIHSTILSEILMGFSACIINETIGNYFDGLANRRQDEVQASSKDLYKDLLRKIISTIKKSFSPTDPVGPLALTLFKIKLKEKTLDIDSGAFLTAANVVEIDSQFDLAKSDCLTEEQIPDHLKHSPVYFRTQLAEILEAANPGMTCQRLLEMIRNSEGVFSIASVEQYASKTEFTRLFRDVAGYSPTEEILQIMEEGVVLPLQSEVDIAPITAITATIAPSTSYQEQVRCLVRAAYTSAYRDMPELFFVHIEDRERGSSCTRITLEERIVGGRENLSTLSAVQNLAKYAQYLEIACSTRAIPYGQYPERQHRIDQAKRIFQNLLPIDKQLLITKLIKGDEIDPAIQDLPESRRLSVQNLAEEISLLANNFTVPLQDRDDGYYRHTPAFNRVRDFLATLRDSFNQAYSEVS